MKVLYLVPDLFGAPGGIARYCQMVARALTETSGVELDILALRDEPDAEPDRRYLAGENWSYVGFGSNRRKFTLRALVAMATGGYDVSLSGHVNFTPLLHGVPSRHRRRVTFIYGLDAWHRLPLHRRWFLQRASSVIAISQHTARLAIQANDLPADRVCILHNCLDPLLDPTTELTPVNGTSAVPVAGPPSILTVARMWRLESSKGHDSVIRALARVRQTVPQVRYYIVGEGDLRPSLEALACEVGVADAVEFVGRVSDADLQQYYRDCTVFAMPSKTEGFGFVFLEAMAHGRPIVAGNRDAGPEVIGNSDAGLLVDPDDPEQIAEAIERILVDTHLQQRLGEAGRARVTEIFNYQQFQQQLLAYLRPAPTGAAGGG